MKTGAIIQARTSSTRLPKKVLKFLPYNSGITVLEQVIRRVKKSALINDIIVAATTEEEDIKIVEIAKKENVNYFRGSKENVLERYYLSAKENQLDTVVRVTSDCPCIDFELIDEGIKMHISENADFTSNVAKRTFPQGLDFEVLKFSAIEKAYNNATEDFEKEHVCPYIYHSKPELFKIVNIIAKQKNYYFDEKMRITLDTEEDYALLCSIYDYLYAKNNFFLRKDIAELFKEKEWLFLINKKIIQKKIFW